MINQPSTRLQSTLLSPKFHPYLNAPCCKIHNPPLHTFTNFHYNMSIVAEAPDFIKVFSDGTVQRFSPQTVAPSTEWSNVSNGFKYKSKDVTIDSGKHITARIFLPHVPNSRSKLPVLVYFHGGGFCIGSTTWIGYHNFLAKLSAVAKIIVLSVDYRLAPEHKLPIAYEDCYTALEWLKSNHDPWLQRRDLSNVFLSGDSAGGNIAHQVAVKTLKRNIPSIRIKGVMPIHPYMGSEIRTELEKEDGSGNEVGMNDMFWKLSLPEGSDRDYYGCNFEVEQETEWRVFPDTLVFVAELDFLKERGVMYAEFLKRKGVKKVSLVENKGEAHVFHVWNPDSEATSLLQDQMRIFIHGL